jgi:hypothetical protein
MTTLSIHAMHPDLRSTYNAWPGRCGEFEILYLSATWLPQLLAHFPNITHLRFYRLSPACFEAMPIPLHP